METVHRQSSPEETRDRILAAAREVYVRNNGSRGATTREIAQLAGVNEVTLFRHFGSKERLLAEMVGRCCVHQKITEIVEETGDLRADLIRVGFTLARGMEQIEDLIRVHLNDSSLDDSSALFEGPRRIQRAIEGFMSRHVAAGRLFGDPRRLTRAFSGMIFAHVMGKRLWDEHGPTTQGDIVSYTDIFLKGTLRHE
ncbi:TetR/AcrR family transcriptional regulator [bacterium]|nr:MAG: TetR/AcrR family transcriptional regulator [bacterium]